jgi:hypothetical protein
MPKSPQNYKSTLCYCPPAVIVLVIQALKVGAPATGYTCGGASVCAARHTLGGAALEQPLAFFDEASSAITPDRAPSARRSLTVRFALSGGGPAEQTFGRPQAASR